MGLPRVAAFLGPFGRQQGRQLGPLPIRQFATTARHTASPPRINSANPAPFVRHALVRAVFEVLQRTRLQFNITGAQVLLQLVCIRASR